MDRKRLARLAFNTACDRLSADPSLSNAQKLARFNRLREAYEARKAAIGLSAFIGFHRLDRILGTMAREHSEGRIGDQQIHQNNEEAA